MPHTSTCSRSRRVVAALLVAATTCAAMPSFAQSDEDRAAARQMAKDGKKAVDEGRWADAADLFGRAESLVHSPTHLLFLARAHVKLGHLVKAHEIYLRIKKESLPAGAPKAFEDAKSDGEKELLALEPRIPSLKIMVVGAEPKAVTVTMDGAPVSAVLVGISRPVDPGDHKVTAKSDALSAEETISLKEGANETLTLTLKAGGAPAGGDKPPAGDVKPGGDVKPATDDGKTKPPSDAPSEGGGTNGMRIGSFVAIGVGVVGLGLGTVFLLSSNSKKKEKEDLCPGGICPISTLDQVNALDDDFRKARGISTVGFVIGAVGIAAGVTLFVLSSGSSEKKTASGPTVRPWIGLGSAGLSGAF